MILAGFGIALTLMPLARDFAIIDDWTYVRNVEHVMSGQSFQPAEYAQATLVSHTYWGALFASMLGMNFTSLLVATCVLAAIAALTFYFILRRLGYGPLLSALGVALLTLNPYFINLSYSFMTDITFLALLLLSCLCYLMGLDEQESRRGMGLLLLGSVFASLAFLTRQFGIAIPFAALVWLLWNRKRPMRAEDWRRLTAVALLPAAVAIGYYVWSTSFRPTYSGSISREELLDMMRRPSIYITRVSHFLYLSMLLPGVLVPLYGGVRRWKIVAPLMLLAALVTFALWQVKHGIVGQGADAVNELSYYWLTFSIPDPTPIYCVGAALTVWLVAGLVERAWPGFISLARRKREANPTDFLYIVALVVFAGTFLVSAGFLDRYWLPLLPFLIAGGLAGLVGRPRWRLGLVAMAVAVLGVYGSLVHLEMYAEQHVIWQAGRLLVSQGVPYDKIRAGYAWDGYFLGDLARERLGSLDVKTLNSTFPPYLVSDPLYVVGPVLQPNYTLLKQYNYFSILRGLVNKDVLVTERK